MDIPADRHPDTRHFEPLFRYDHLPENLQMISKPIHDVAQFMIELLQDGPELTEGLRKLWEAKNSLVVHAGFCQD
jgi:hypothetical protein